MQRVSKLKHQWPWLAAFFGCGLLLYYSNPSATQPQPKGKMDTPKGEVGKTSYDQIAPVLIGQETFAQMKANDIKNKPAVMARQKALLEERYDLTPRADNKAKMSRGKPV